jgi:4-carboxymuconolactone decarboxylase
MSERFEKGKRLTNEMMGADFTAAIERAALSGEFGADMARLSVEQAFGDIWQRPGLDRKIRSVVVISTLIATKQISELKNHIRFGLNNGLTVKEIEEILIQCQPYLGWPAVGTATGAVIEVLRERGLAGAVRTSEEDGLL